MLLIQFLVSFGLCGAIDIEDEDIKRELNFNFGDNPITIKNCTFRYLNGQFIRVIRECSLLMEGNTFSDNNCTTPEGFIFIYNWDIKKVKLYDNTFNNFLYDGGIMLLRNCYLEMAGNICTNLKTFEARIPENP